MVNNTDLFMLFQHLDGETNDLVVDHSLFEEYMWPSIAHRVPAFENLKVCIYSVNNSISKSCKSAVLFCVTVNFL